MERRTLPNASPTSLRPRYSARHAALALAVFFSPAIASAQARGMARPYANGIAIIEIDGAAVQVREVEGGTPVGTVVVEQPGPDGVAKKHIAGIKAEDITADVGFGEGSAALLEWVSATLKAPTMKNGRFLLGDATGKASEAREFQNAFVSAFTVPTLDATAKTSAAFTVHISPATVRLKDGAGAEMRSPMGAKPQQWLSSNFRLDLDGLEGNRVVRIDSFTIGRAVTRDDPGAFRAPTTMPGRLEIPNITITLSETGAESWKRWRDDFLMNGAHADANEKSGAIVFLGPDLKTELGRVTLDHCGLVRLASDAAGSPNDRVNRLTAELYCERMGFKPKTGVR